MNNISACAFVYMQIRLTEGATLDATEGALGYPRRAPERAPKNAEKTLALPDMRRHLPRKRCSDGARFAGWEARFSAQELSRKPLDLDRSGRFVWPRDANKTRALREGGGREHRKCV